MLPNLIQAWSFGASANNDSLVSAISSILALLVKTISTLIDFRDLGIQLCKTLLQREQLKLVSRALAAQRQKEHVISPSLRLLTEIVTFDGGAMARDIIAAKSFTFDGKFLARNLSLWKTGTEDAEEDKRRPAVRSNAVRYVLANLKHQSTEAKVELLKYGNVIRALFEHLQHDPVDVLKDIFDTLKTHVLDSKTLQRSSKSFLLHERNLSSIASLYRADHTSDKTTLSQKLAHEFLLYACTEPKAGVLRSPAGWYPPGTEKVREHSDESASIDLGLDSVEWFNRFETQVPVRNSTLAGLAQTLRPMSSNMESELLLGIFRAAPELVADYFYKKSGFAFDPKLTATWTGYATFIFSTLQLPVPEKFDGSEDYGSIPPPTNIVMENLLPQPLSQKILTRCLNQQISLITFFAVRLVTVALQKLRTVLSQYTEAADNQGFLWTEGVERLRKAFMARCPKMKEVVATYRKTNSDDKLQREAVLRLLSLYCQVLPEAASEEKFDISAPLLEELAYFENQTLQTDSAQDEAAGDVASQQHRLVSLDHMLQIAAHSSDVRWLHKPEDRTLSPLMTVIKLLSSMDIQKMPMAMWTLARSICEENGIVQNETDDSAFTALICSLRLSKATWSSASAPNNTVYGYLDDAFSRTTRKPIKYEDDLDEVERDDKLSRPVSLLHLTLAEQWPFAADLASEHCKSLCASKQVASFMFHYSYASSAIGEDDATLTSLRKRAQSISSESQLEVMSTIDAETVRSSTLDLITQLASVQAPTLLPREQAAGATGVGPIVIPYGLLAPSVEHPNVPGLHRWTNKDVPTAISDGDLSDLILCLSSNDPEIYRAAFRNLRTFSARVDHLRTTNPTAFPDATQYHLLIGILINTAGPLLNPSKPSTAQSQANGAPPTPPADDLEDQGPIPSLLIVYAALAARILQDPLHPLYAPLNDFHLKGPRWDIDRLVSYWTHTLLFTGAGASRGLPVARQAGKSGNSDAAYASLLGLGGQNEPVSLDAAVRTADVSTPLRFLLQYVYLSLRDAQSLEIVRKKGTLEPLLALAASPGCRHETLEMLVKILWRTTFLKGGSDMLITRKGIVSWLSMRIAAAALGSHGHATKMKRGNGRDDDLTSEKALHMLVHRIWETCDQNRAMAWSNGHLGEVVQRLTKGLGLEKVQEEVPGGSQPSAL